MTARHRARMIGAGMVWALVLPLARTAPAGEEEDASSREEEMFGAEQEKPEKPPAAGPEQAEEKAREGKLAEAENPLTIGGELYLRLSYNVMDEGSLADQRLQSPNLLHLYLDGRPNDRLRAFVRGRLLHDFTVRNGETDAFGRELEPLQVFLDQLWLKFDIARTVFVTLGRQPARWGSGRFWNPTDFLNQQRRDPLAIFDERLGVSILKLHLPLEWLGWNFYAVANLDGASSPEELGGAWRAELLLGKTEISCSAALRKDEPLRLGLDLSTAIWDFDVRVEGALLHGEKKPFWRGRFDPATPVFPEPFNREDDWIPQVSAGAELAIRYSDQDSVLLGLEYFYNDAGYSDAKLYPWLALQGDLIPFYLGRQYVSGYLVLMQPGNWNDTSFILSAIANLSDGTGITRLDYQTRLLTYLELDVFLSVFTGVLGEFHFKIDVPPVAGIPGLEQGIRVPAQRLLIGLWLALKV